MAVSRTGLGGPGGSGGPGGPGGGTRPPARLRLDARRNRDLLLTTARDLFARHGLDVPLDRIAKEAGVGNATLYRHFPTRQALVGEVFANAASLVAEAGAEALAAEDAWRAIECYFERILELVAADRGINDLVTRSVLTAPGLLGTSRRNAATVGSLVARAQEQGTMRADVTTTDLLFVFGALCRSLPVATELRPDLWRRHLALLLDGFRVRAAHPLPVPPVGEERLDRMFAELWAADARAEAPTTA
ncbi:transcriptional regulator, TetR family [Streptomyces sp. TLI_053]|uniref:TetR/AcrR family transcriptional regulator n=1 Tax=Streptomyces sp. TLI_053 TaxID=1855352 RepID=UPI00087B4831|nr:TetR/AcrR family transcriptional regulator [Streptomyces sp. TLI_053]SDT19868.1 transcriptional regulator, TetR family [Streptomyces sp. TLI_053]